MSDEQNTAERHLRDHLTDGCWHFGLIMKLVCR